MKRLFQPGKTRIPFMACWCAMIFCLLFALNHSCCCEDSDAHWLHSVSINAGDNCATVCRH